MRSRRLALMIVMALGLYVFAAGCEKAADDGAAAPAVEPAAEEATPAATQGDD